jgi:nitrogenase molybdenum-iron protein alpha/beta subunit
MVLITAMPMASITGTQYDRIARELSAKTGKLIAEVPARSLQGDWLDGYGQVLAAIAREIPLDPDAPRSPEKVAVIGPLMDRTEADRLADARELRRILEDGLGLDLRAIWPSNATVAELAAVAEAGTIIGLPYGARATKVLKKRTGATVIDAPLPTGPSGVEAFVRAVAGPLGLSERAEAFLAGERARWEQPWSLACETVRGRRFAVVADPWLAQSTVSLLRDAGADVVAAQSTSFDPKPVLDLPSPGELGRDPAIDMFIVPTRGIDYALRLARPFFEFGFTSYGTHAFFDAPLFGWGGAVNLLSGVAGNLALFDAIGGSRSFDLRRVADSYQVAPDTADRAAGTH